MEVEQESIEQYITDLKQSNKLGRLLLDNADEAHFFCSMDEKLIYVSPAFEKITDYTTQELFKKNFIPFVHPDDEERTMKLWEGLYKGEFFNDVEYRIVKKDGESACAQYAAVNPHVVVLDLNMPGIGGLETIRHQKEAR